MTEQSMNVRLVGENVRPDNFLAVVTHGDKEIKVRYNRDTPAPYQCEECGRSTYASCAHSRVTAAMIRLLAEQQTWFHEQPEKASDNRFRADRVRVTPARLHGGARGILFKSGPVLIPMTAAQAVRIATSLADEAAKATDENKGKLKWGEEEWAATPEAR